MYMYIYIHIYLLFCPSVTRIYLKEKNIYKKSNNMANAHSLYIWPGLSNTRYKRK